MSEIENSLRYLQPFAIAPFVLLQTTLAQMYEEKKLRHLFMPFESYRSPERQEKLLNRGKGVTKARAWQSAHQWGLAVDFVPYWLGDGTRGWTWEEGPHWKEMHEIAKSCGLRVPSPDWDMTHVVHPAWYEFKRLADKQEYKVPTAPVK